MCRASAAINTPEILCNFISISSCKNMNISDANLRETTQSIVFRSTEEKDGIRYDSHFARIEELIKGNTFTREEITRLMEILNSRMDKEEEQKSSSNAEGDAQLIPWMPDILKTPSKGKQQYIERTMNGYHCEKSDVQVGVSASPIDIARAYMAGRTTEEGQIAQPTNEFARKPLLLPSPSPKPSICWPGAVLHDQHGHTTPQSQRGRNRLHDFPRTPYSRPILSKSKTKLQADSGGYAITATPFQQPETSPYGQVKSRGETVDAYGSVGPIRRIRNKFGSEVRPRGSIFLSSPKRIPPKAPTTQVFGGFLPSAEKNIIPGETSDVLQFRSADNASRPSDRDMSNTNITSIQAARKALELLDRNKPTPKQKEAELKLATAWGSSPDATDVSNVENGTSMHVEESAPQKNTDMSSPNFPVESNKTSGKLHIFGNIPGKGMNEARDAAAGTAKASCSIFNGPSNRTPAADATPIFSLIGTSGPQAHNWSKNSLGTTNHRQTEKSVQFSLPPLSNGQNAKITTEAESVKNHGMKPSLPSIAIKRAELRPGSSDNGLGFTFPVSASAGVLSEPPTPSITPSPSSSVMSQLIGTPIPPYTFGTKKSEPSVVFSFPSTSSASNHDDSELKFSFGSDKKTRLSFSSFGTDAAGIHV